jgi:integrase
MQKLNSWVEDWIAQVCESETTKRVYLNDIRIFEKFLRDKWNISFADVVNDWRQVRRKGINESEEFIEQWNDIVKSFNTYLKSQSYTPLFVKKVLTTVKSFFHFWDIPVKVLLPKNACVMFHNKDLTKEELRQILAYASPRDRVIWLLMAESGMRGSTAVSLQYWQIKEDFESGKVPMCIKLPSASLKDHVGDRFTFIGEDGYKALKEYLTPRMPLADSDLIFASERKGKVSGETSSVASLSVKFSRIVLKLKLAECRGRKPKAIRLHGLRKYFRNNMKAESAYVEFWLGHTLGTDAHYISRDISVHRKEYAKGYESLRIYETPLASKFLAPEEFKKAVIEYLKTEDGQRLVSEAIKNTLIPTSEILKKLFEKT